MALLFDTNIILNLVRNQAVHRIVNPNRQPTYISVVTVAEARSIAFQNGWGEPKLSLLDVVFEEMVVFDINNPDLIDRYVQIDAYSQRRHPHVPARHRTPRNMGKNDLWIAATASFMEMPLYTTDGDFAHLHDVFISVHKFDPEQFR